MKISKKAEEMSQENNLTEEQNQAYIDNVGEKYATAEDAQEAYTGEFSSNKEFAQDMAKQLGSIDKNVSWPYTCIDWEEASNELMHDYFESNGFYFRNL